PANPFDYGITVTGVQLRTRGLARLRRHAYRVPRSPDRVELGAAGREQILRGLQGPETVLRVAAQRGLHQHGVVENLDGLLYTDAGGGAAVAGRAHRLTRRIAADGGQVEPVVAGTGRGVNLLVGDLLGVTVGVAELRGVVHVADRAAANQIDLLAHQEVRRV